MDKFEAAQEVIRVYTGLILYVANFLEQVGENSTDIVLIHEIENVLVRMNSETLNLKARLQEYYELGRQ